MDLIAYFLNSQQNRFIFDPIGGLIIIQFPIHSSGLKLLGHNRREGNQASSHIHQDQLRGGESLDISLGEDLVVGV